MSIYVQCGILSLMGSCWEGIFFFCCSWTSPETTRMRVSKRTAAGITTHARIPIPEWTVTETMATWKMGTKQMASKCLKQNSRLWGAWLWILTVTARQPLRLAALSTRWPVALVSNPESNGLLTLMFHQGEFIDTICDFIKKCLYFQTSTCLEPSRSSFRKAGVTIQTL